MYFYPFTQQKIERHIGTMIDKHQTARCRSDKLAVQEMRK